MKLHLLIISVCSIADGFRLSGFRLPSFKPPSFKPPSIKPPSLPKLPFKAPSLPKLPKIPKPSQNGLNTFFNGGNFLATLGMIGVSAAGMVEADRLQNEALEAQARQQQKHYEHQKDMAEQVEAATTMGAPKVCLDCYQEFEKMRNAIDEESKTWCSQFSGVPGWYDPVKQTCTDAKIHIFFDEKITEIFKRFGGANNKCLKANSEYLIQLNTNQECKVADDLMLRCLFDKYHQIKEVPNSCGKMN